jgi:hypothetical protein
MFFENGILSKFDPPGPRHLRQFTENETFQEVVENG